MNENKTYKEYKNKLDISPIMQKGDSTNAVVYSFDLDTSKFTYELKMNGQPLSLANASEVNIVLYFGGDNPDKYPKANLVGTIEDKLNGKISFVMPKQYLGFDGQVLGEINVTYNNGQSLTAGYFSFVMKSSYINGSIEIEQQVYVEQFEDLKNLIGKQSEDINKILVVMQEEIDKSNAKVDEIKDLIVKNDVYKKTDGEKLQKELIDGRYSKMLDKHFSSLQARGDFWDESFARIGVDITFFGADEQLKDNATQINNAIKYAFENEYSRIFIPKGTFNIKAKNLTILLKSGVSIVGSSKQESILKIAEDTGDWGYLLIGGQKEVLENVTIENLTLDCNLDNVVAKTERWQNSNRVLINFGENKNCRINNCHFITNGIWGIRAFSENGVISNCSFRFYPPTYDKASFDLSTIWIGGTNNRVYNNDLIAFWREDFIPETAIETQGHFSYYDNNVVRGYKVGIIESSNTGYENPLNPINGFGADSNVIANNTLECLVGGITLWAMNTKKEAVIDGLRISNNKIKIIEGNNIKSRYRYGIGIFKATPQTGATHDGVQLGKLMNCKISGNIIEFEKRVVVSSLTYSDVGIRLDTEFDVENTDVQGNTLYNIGGFGVFLNANLDGNLNPYYQVLKNTNISNNIFSECHIPIRINTAVKRTTIIGNMFIQQVEYENIEDNMLLTIEAYPKDTAYTEGFYIKDNIVKSSIEYHRPFYPRYDLPLSISKYSRDFNAILEENEPGKVVVQGNTNRPFIIQASNFLLDKNGVRKSATNTIQSTIGVPYGKEAIDVQIVSSSGRFLEVNDALDFKPSQTIVIQKNDNTYSVVSILAVYKNYLYVATEDSIKNAKVGYRVNFYSDNLK